MVSSYSNAAVLITSYTLAAVVHEILPGGASGRHITIPFMCKYVRREIRALFNEDREALFDAMESLFSIDTTSGKQIYGPEYKSAENFVTQHNTLAGAIECDHMHNGLGFLNNHLALTFG
jgi:hypothetical protein